MKNVKNKLHETSNDTVDLEVYTHHKIYNAFGHEVNVFDSDFERSLFDLCYFFH